MRRKLAFISAALVILLLGVVVPWSATRIASGSNGDGGLLNPGFEEGLQHWTVASQPDAAVVVGTEGPAQFRCYADMNVTVSPFKGSKMLRLGTPKRLAESQKQGANTVSQTFTSNSNTLEFAFRLFSWEARGYDVFSFDLKDASGKSVGNVTAPNGSPLWVTMPDGSRINLSNLPRTWSLDVGKQGQFLDTGWVQVKISSIPIGQTLTLIFSVGGTANTAHATWAYFDNVNQPPVAKFAFGPQEPLEGDIVQLMDGSYDPDPGDTIASWQWDVAWTDYGNVTWHSYSDLQNPFFVPPDEQNSYSVSLTVTDTHGASTTITNGQVPIDGYLYGGDIEPTDHKVPLLVVENADPKVNALDIEALPGQTITLIGRFIDPGWLDTHSATWSFTGTSLTAIDVTLQEDNFAYIDTGMVTGKVTLEGAQPGDTFVGTLTVMDNDSGTGSDDFTITVVADSPSNREPNDNLTSAPQLASDGIYLSYIQSQGDVDLFEVVGSDGQTLPAGSELLITLKDLPADYDLVVLSQQPSDIAPFQRSPFQRSAFEASPFQRSPFQRSAFQMAPFQRSPFQRSPFQRSPFQRSPFQRSPFQRSPFQRSPFQRSSFDEYPLSELGYTGLDGNNIGGTDISLSELGLGSIDGNNVQVVGFSANRGLNNETVLASSELDGTRFFVAVVGYNGAFSTAPYSLQVEMSRPLDLAEWLSENGFTYEAPVDSWNGPTETTPLYDYTGDPLTLFVTQRERLIGLYGQAQWDALETKLIQLAQNDAICADIVSVPLSIYETADNNPDDVAALDEVASNIRDIVQEALISNPSIQYVVLVGSDDIIPYYRVPDETIISNERFYLMSSFLVPGSPLFYSVLGGWNLSDDYYVDAQPIPWQGRSLYLPDLPVGRLVETPEEIIGTANAFLSSNGTLNPATALVTGYDFFGDGAQAVANTLSGAGLTTDTLINDSWTSDDLKAEFLNQTHDINNINAHFAHYAALSASGFVTNNLNDFLSSEEVTGAGTALANKLVFSMGCHAGLNVPDRAAESADPGMDIDPALDFPQAMAMERAIYVASTGYGLGDDEGIGGTERLMDIFAENLMQDGTTAGGALVLAKQDYLGSLSTMTVYDEKSSIQFTLYGLPQYHVGSSSGSSSTSSQPMLSQGTSTALSAAEQPPLSLTITIIDGATSSTTAYSLQEVVTPAGSYFTADGDSQATAFRAIQPRVVIPIAPSTDGSVVHGLLLEGGEFTDMTGFDPVITLPTTEWVVDPSEAQILLPNFWPAELATVNSLEAGEELTQTLVVIPGQFRPDGSISGSEVTGTERLYTNLTFELLRSSDSNDYEPPVVSNVELRLVGDNIAVTVEASDPSGIARVVVLSIRNGELIATDFICGDVSASGRFTVDIPGSTTDDKMIIQVVDGSGNVATATSKGANISLIRVDAGPDSAFGSYYPVRFTARVSDFDSLTENGTSPVFYIWNFGDGTSASGLLPPDYPVDANGDAVFSVMHTYMIPDSVDTTQVTATLKVTAANGGIGVGDVTLRRIWDPQGDAASPDGDLVGGYVTNDATTMTIGLRVAGSISSKYHYRISLETAAGDTFHLQNNNGQVTGDLHNVQCSMNGNELILEFDLAEIGLISGDYLWFSAETQGGVPGEPTAGTIDHMPDSGVFLYVVQ